MNVNDSLWSRCKLMLVPPITDSKVEEMLAVMKPLVQVENHRFREIDITGVHRRGVSYIWDPKPGRPVKQYRGSLNDVTIMTFHKYGAPSLFKPSLVEVCASIRRFVPDWKLVRHFWLNSEGLDCRNVIGDCHWCPCVLFGEEMADVQDAEWEGFVERCKEIKP